MNRFYSLIIIFSIVILSYSCRQWQDLKESDFVIPLTSTSLKDSSIIAGNYLREGQYRMVHFVNNDCSICFNDIVTLDSIIRSGSKHMPTSCIFVYGESLEIFKYYLEKMSITVPVFRFDNTSSIPSVLSKDNSIRTILLDKDNRIVFKGNIVSKSKDMDRILKYIER